MLHVRYAPETRQGGNREQESKRDANTCLMDFEIEPEHLHMENNVLVGPPDSRAQPAPFPRILTLLIVPTMLQRLHTWDHSGGSLLREDAKLLPKREET